MGKLSKRFRRLQSAAHNRWLANGFGNRVYGPALSETLAAPSPAASDISDHVNELYFLAALLRPRLLVELGTRGGESTRALLAAVAESEGVMLSIDIDDCSAIALPPAYRRHWSFLRGDDVALASRGFPEFCAARGLEPSPDLIFIDTSHLYEHTKREIAAWAPLVRPGGLLVFHDTNMHKRYVRLDNSVGHGWDNERGVMRAIEEFLGRHYDENCAFSDRTADWLVRHQPHCNGLTVLARLPDR